MEYLSNLIDQTRIVTCTANLVSAQEAKSQNTLPSKEDLQKAKRRFAAVRIHGAVTLVTVLEHLATSEEAVLGFMKFTFDINRLKRRKRKGPKAYYDYEIEELPWFVLGNDEGTETALTELVTMSKMVVQRENRDALDRELLSHMLHDAAFIIAKTTCQGSA